MYLKTAKFQEVLKQRIFTTRILTKIIVIFSTILNLNAIKEKLNLNA